MITDFQCFELYLAIKQHFTKSSYDYFKYSGKVTVKKETFFKRKDRFFFERLSRKKTQKEILDFFVANYVESPDPSKVWVGDLKTSGEQNYLNWQKRILSLEYTFKQELKNLIEDQTILDAINVENNRHPIVLKYYLKKQLSLETLIILDDLLKFGSKMNDDDIIWKNIKQLMNKYRPFLHYDKSTYVTIIKEMCLTRS